MNKINFSKIDSLQAFREKAAALAVPQKRGNVQQGLNGSRMKTAKKRESSTKLPAATANNLTKQAMRVLDLKGFRVWRQNNGGVYDPVKKIFRKGSSTPGISDILGFHRKTGIIVACEIKAGKDKISPDQEVFLNSVKRAGGHAIIIRTVDDITELYKSL
jgi:hypothetical protein